MGEQSVEELVKEGQHRWFKATELYQIFLNYKRLDILISQPQIRPPSGSFFAIQRHKMREFKQDGHNWAKKKDRKNVQEAHERLKIENVEMLVSNYVHGQDNESFQRRSYRMLDPNASDITLFHYLETERKRKRSDGRKENVGELPAEDPPVTRETLCRRFEVLLSLKAVNPRYNPNSYIAIIGIKSKLKSLLEDEEDDEMLTVLIQSKNFSEIVNEKLYQKLLKRKLHTWLVQKLMEGGGGGLAELDWGGLGVLHFAAALGYNWALEAIITAGVSVNSPDVNGRTALHWASHCGRMDTMKSLISKGADPELKFTSTSYDIIGTRASELASAGGYKETCEYLEEKEGSLPPLEIVRKLPTGSFNLDSQQPNKRRCELGKEVVQGKLPASSSKDVTAGSSSVIVYHDSNQLSLPPKITDTRNQNKIEANAEAAVGAVCSNQASSGFHFSSDTCYGDGMQDDNDFENQSFPQATRIDFFPNPGTPCSPWEMSDLTKYMEQFSERDNKIVNEGTKQGNSKKLNVFEVTGFPSGIVDHESDQLSLPSSVDHESSQLSLPSQTAYTSNLSNIQGYANLGDGMPGYDNGYEDRPFVQARQNVFLPNPGIPGSLCESPELMKSMEWFSEGKGENCESSKRIEEVYDLPDPGAPGSPSALQEIYLLELSTTSAVMGNGDALGGPAVR